MPNYLDMKIVKEIKESFQKEIDKIIEQKSI